MLVIFAAQSKTGFIALLASLPFAYFCMGKSFSKMRINVLSSILGVALINWSATSSLENIEQYYRLFEYGLSVSSFDERLLIWKSVLATSIESGLILLLFGAGRGSVQATGLQASVFDNDYIYILNTFGLIGFTLFTLIFIFSILKLSSSKLILSNWLLFILCFAPILGMATDFISSLKILVLVGIVSSAVINEHTVYLKK